MPDVIYSLYDLVGKERAAFFVKMYPVGMHLSAPVFCNGIKIVYRHIKLAHHLFCHFVVLLYLAVAAGKLGAGHFFYHSGGQGKDDLCIGEKQPYALVDPVQHKLIGVDGCERLIAEQAECIPKTVVPVDNIYIFGVGDFLCPFVQKTQGILCPAAVFIGGVDIGFIFELFLNINTVAGGCFVFAKQSALSGAVSNKSNRQHYYDKL